MIKTNSIYRQFYQKLVVATFFFVIIIAAIFYAYTSATVLKDIKSRLLSAAVVLDKLVKDSDLDLHEDKEFATLGVSIEIVENKTIDDITFVEYQKNGQHHIKLFYPLELSKNKFIEIDRNIDSSIKMLNKIFNNLLLLSIIGVVLILLYATTLTRLLLLPIIQITEKLSNMNENYLTSIDKKDLPTEFHPLANSINILTNKIQTYVKFKKELFIGAAHELKTPLAVMKLKNEVTLMKTREVDKYEETLKLNVSRINEMNKMISSILDIGRQEGAQFETPTKVDLVNFLRIKTNDFRMLSAQKKITITFYSNINSYITLIQTTLLNQIIQNLVQNAIKFTPDEKSIAIRMEKAKEKIIITVTDEGKGIDEKIDLFAPFKRVGDESGAGLGLFLAKIGADALHATIKLKNRVDGQSGCIGTLTLKNKPIKE